MKDSIAVGLEKSRQELLDLSIRSNSLLNFVPRAVSLTVQSVSSAEIFTALVDNKPGSIETNTSLVYDASDICSKFLRVDYQRDSSKIS